MYHPIPCYILPSCNSLTFCKHSRAVCRAHKPVSTLLQPRNILLGILCLEDIYQKRTCLVFRSNRPLLIRSRRVHNKNIDSACRGQPRQCYSICFERHPPFSQALIDEKTTGCRLSQRIAEWYPPNKSLIYLLPRHNFQGQTMLFAQRGEA